MRRSAWLLALAGAFGGCGDPPAPTPLDPPAVSAAAARPAKRPTRRYYLGRTGARCEVYSVDDDKFSIPLPTPCPLDLAPGERFRLAGRTCIRESSDATRVVPVVCPDPLTNEQKQDRADAGAAANP